MSASSHWQWWHPYYCGISSVPSKSALTSDSASESTTAQEIITPNEPVVENLLDVNNLVIQNQTVSTISDSTLDDEYAEQMAWSVIRGNYGNNPVRRQKLGEDYQIIQDKVNEFYRKGLVH